MSNKKRKKSDSDNTLAALLREKPRRGRPRRSVSRQSVYVALTDAQKSLIADLGNALPEALGRADVADLAIAALDARLDVLRQAVSDRARELPEGITDLESLYFLWDLAQPDVSDAKWTSIRLSPQQVIEFGRLQGIFRALCGANRSQVFTLALTALERALQAPLPETVVDADTFLTHVTQGFL